MTNDERRAAPIGALGSERSEAVDMTSTKRAARRLGAVAALALAAALAAAGVASAQAGATPFAGFKHDASQPIQVAADSLEVRNADNAAIFRGNVVVAQGVVRLKANTLEVRYRRGGGGQPQDGAIDRLRATGDVLISNGKETAKANAADYDVAEGVIVLTGDVLLAQNDNAIKAEKLTIDLATGRAVMGGGGRVSVQLNPNQAN